MTGKWDTSTKHLMSENPEHFIKWLLPEAEFKGKAKHKSPNMNDRQIEADNLYEIILNGLLCLIHIEFQSKYDRHMARRMWEYNTLATFKYRLPTCSFVIYLKKCTVTEAKYIGTFPDGRLIHNFHFMVIKLWETPLNVLKQTGLVGIFPLMILAQGGKQPEVVEEVIAGITSAGGKAAKELLSLTYIFASLVFEKEVDRHWLKRRFQMLRDVLRDSWAYQEIMQEGHEEGHKKGHEEGRKKGHEEGHKKGREEERQQRLKDHRQMLMTMVQLRFPNLTGLAKKLADAIQEPETLQSLLLELLAAENEEQAKNALIAVRLAKNA